MIKRSGRIAITLLLFIGVLLLQGCMSKSLLSRDLDQVDKMTIVNHRDGNLTYELKAEKNNNLVKSIYESVASTKTRTNLRPSANAEQTSEPYFIISVDYKDGPDEVIYSTESGRFIYKRLSGTGWIGGPNKDLIELVKNCK